MWNKKELEILADKYAKESNIDTDLVYSIISVESGWNPFVSRYEPHTDKYVYNAYSFADKCGITMQTEELAQKHSYGLGQLMGFVARDLGHKTLLSELFIPEVNLRYMMKFLKHKLEKYGDEASAIAAYNAGSPRKTDGGMFFNQKYVDKVYYFLNSFRKLK